MSIDINQTVTITGTISKINPNGTYRVRISGKGEPHHDFPADALAAVAPESVETPAAPAAKTAKKKLPVDVG
jgi:hypothetical protein